MMKSVVGVTTAALLAISVEAVPAAAQPAEPTVACSVDGTSAADAQQNDAGDMTQIDGAQAGELAENAAELLDRGEVTVHAPADALVRDGTKTYFVEAGEENFTSVTFPIAGDYSELLSNLTVLFDADGAVVQYSESLIGEGSSGNFQVTTYVDGALTNSEDTGIPYLADEELRSSVADTSEFAAEGMNTGACLAAVLGVSGVVGAIIAKVCVGACAVPMTPVTAPVCAACIGGFAVVGGASIAAIASCF